MRFKSILLSRKKPTSIVFCSFKNKFMRSGLYRDQNAFLWILCMYVCVRCLNICIHAFLWNLDTRKFPLYMGDFLYNIVSNLPKKSIHEYICIYSVVS